MKKKSAKQPKKTQVKLRDIKPRKDARGGATVTGRITSIAVDPSDPSKQSAGTPLASVTDLVIDPFNPNR